MDSKICISRALKVTCIQTMKSPVNSSGNSISKKVLTWKIKPMRKKWFTPSQIAATSQKSKIVGQKLEVLERPKPKRRCPKLEIKKLKNEIGRFCSINLF